MGEGGKKVNTGEVFSILLLFNKSSVNLHYIESII
jgi:hypothetical protein